MLNILRAIFYIVAILTMVIISCYILTISPADQFVDARIEYLLYGE